MAGFQNRTEAGKTLAEKLAARGYDKPIVLALPRGGVPVAYEVARRLNAPLDLVMVRKIGVPQQPELAAAAVVNGDHPRLAINDTIAKHAGLSRQDIETLAEVQLAEIRRRRQLYLGGRDPLPVEGRTAIVIDDGIATGATMRASLLATRERNPARLVLAVPVSSASALAELSALVDETECLLVPRMLYAVGAHYNEFDQTTDAEVTRLMQAANAPAATED